MDAPESDPKLGTSVDGRYRLDERLAAGGMGVVYKAEQVGIGKPVAVKFLHEAFAGIPDLVRRFQREVSAMSRVAHPHLVSVIDSGVQAGVPYLVMDYQAGKPLAEVLDQGALPAARAVGIARQVLAGVGHAHASGVVHRDLKPDNIILLGDVGGDFVKILDFGLAKMVTGSGAGASQLTNTGFALGTPGYMAPEQARGTPADERADLYAVGVILYHMIVGQKPFVSDSPMAVLRMHMDEPPVPPRKAAKQRISSELDAAILRALEKEPDRRWATASEFVRALEATPEGRASGVPLMDVSMQEVVDESHTEIGHKAPSPPPKEKPKKAKEKKEKPKRAKTARRGSSWIARLIVTALIAGGLAFGWSRLSRREQKQVKQKLDDAVKVARGAWHSITDRPDDPPPLPPLVKETPPPPVEKPIEKPAATANAPTPPPPVEKPEVASAPPEKSPPSADPAEADDEDDDTEPAPPSDTPGARLEAAARAAETPPSEAQAAAKTLEPPRADAKHAEPARSDAKRPAEPKRPAPAPAARRPTLNDAEKQLAAGKTDEAIQTLYLIRRHAPSSPAVALLLGHAYFRKLWRTDGLREYSTAVQLSPQLRRDRLLIHNAVAALDSSTFKLARSVIRNRIGPAALPEVRRAAKDAKHPKTAKRAARLAAELQQPVRQRRR